METKPATPSPLELMGSESLPIMPFKGAIQETLQDPRVNTMVVSAGTGAGKTRMIPQFIREIMTADDRLLVTQPRRLTTETSAATLSADLGSELGDEVGFQHGKGRLGGKDTRTMAITEGSLLRKISSDPLLSDYSYVMVDEWHERHKETDFVTALLLKAQKLRAEKHKKPLKLIITSATIDSDKLVNGLTAAKSIEVPGRLYPISEVYEPVGSLALSADEIPEKASFYSQQMVVPGRNLIIFMPGDRMINQTYEAIKKAGFIDMVNVRKLIGKMSQEEQAEAIKGHADKPGIIIATPVAETGLTIPNADVISSGLVNVKVMDPYSGLEYLLEVKHNKSGIIQQKGRAGRTGPGTFRYLGTKAEFDSLEQYKAPEVITQDLITEALLLDSLGISPEDLAMIDKPNPYNWERAQRNLFIIGAINPWTRRLTEVGKEMLKIPVDPHFSRAMVEAKKLGCLEPVVSATALAQLDSIFVRPQTEQQEELIKQAKKAFFSKWPGSDFLANLDIIRQYQQQPLDHRTAWAQNHYLRPEALEAAMQQRAKLLQVLKVKDEIQEVGIHDGKTATLVEQAFVTGFSDKLMFRNGADNHYTLVLDQNVANLIIDENSAAHIEQPDNLLVMGRNYSRTYTGRTTRAQLCQRARLSWLPKIYQKAFKR